MEEWRLLPLDIDKVGNQLGRSEALFEGLTGGEGPTLHWYLTTSPTIVLGLNQQTTILDLSQCAALGLEVYRRRGGGNIVHLTPTFLSLDIALPADHPLHEKDIVKAYEWVGNLWTATLQELGVKEARTIPIAEARAIRDKARNPGEDEEGKRRLREEKLAEYFCFGTLSPFETVVPPLRVGLPPRKLVGLCQIRRRSGTIWQAGLAQFWEPQLLSRVINLDVEERKILAAVLLERASCLHDYGEIDSKKIITTFQAILQQTLHVALVERGWSIREEEKAKELSEGTYQRLNN